MTTTYDRFWALVDRAGGPAACWPWLGRRTAAGVPVFVIRGRRTTARRYAYRMEYGDPGPLRVRVTCGTADCVNWRHTTVATAALIATSNGSAAAVNAARRACREGHALQAGNLYVRADGRRECLRCKRARRARHR